MVNGRATLATVVLRDVSLQLHGPRVTCRGHQVPEKELIVPNDRRCESKMVMAGQSSQMGGIMCPRQHLSPFLFVSENVIRSYVGKCT